MLSETILNEHSLFMDRVGLVLQWRRDIERWEYKKDKERLFRERNVQYCKDHLSEESNQWRTGTQTIRDFSALIRPAQS